MKSRAATSLGTIGFMAGAVVFATLAGMFLSRLLGSTYSRDPVRAVVVAARPLAAGEPMRKEDLRTALWPVSSVPDGAYRSVEEVVRASRVPLIPLVRGEAVLMSHLSQSNAGIGIAPLIDRNHRAMSIRTDDPVTLARLIYPGARVDLISTIREVGAGGKPITTSQTVIQNAKVLAVGEDIDPLSSSRRDKNKQKSGGAMSASTDADGREARGVVTLLVTLQQAESLSLASREGKIDVVLRGPRDGETIATGGATAARLFNGGRALAIKESEGLAVSLPESQPVHKVKVRRARAAGRALAARTAPVLGADSGSGGGMVIFRGKAR